jgi:glycosyltransferase involved in cell wall biosynthesis
MTGIGQPSISVVVPTRDRPRALARCLEALAVQTVLEVLEVIVVDDGSVAEKQVAEVVARHSHARVIRGRGGGPAAARNAGARAARGSFLCFTDDDCRPRPNWAEELVAALKRGADAAGGTTTLTRAGALAQAVEIIFQAPAAVPPHDGSDVSFVGAGNIACTRSAFDAVPFNELYPDAAGEDREWCDRLTSSGFVLRSAPDACVVHDQELTLRHFFAQQVRYGQGAFRFRRRGAEPLRLEPPSFYVALLRRAFAKGVRVGVLVLAAQAATAGGYVRAWAAARKETRSVKPGTASGAPRREGQ